MRGSARDLSARKHSFQPQVRGVAQPGRAPGSGPGGRRFESSLPDHYFSHILKDLCISLRANVQAKRKHCPDHRRPNSLHATALLSEQQIISRIRTRCRRHRLSRISRGTQLWRWLVPHLWSRFHFRRARIDGEQREMDRTALSSNRCVPLSQACRTPNKTYRWLELQNRDERRWTVGHT